MNVRNTRCLAVVTMAVLLGGCAGAQLKKNQELDAVLATGDYRQVATIAEDRMGLDTVAEGEPREPVRYSPKHVLEHLEAAEAWRMLGDQDRALEHYDAAESALGDVDENTGGKAMGKVGAALINETLATYTPSPAESVLINYYKALMFWAAGRADFARVELNRGDERTRRAVERYAKELEKAQAEAAKNNSNHTYDNPAVAQSVGGQFPEMSQWQPYAEFVLPPATFLQALYLAHSGEPADREKSRELYERLLGIVGGHPVLEADYAELSQPGFCGQSDCVWILVERGHGPELRERRFDYPVVTHDGLVSVQLALPALASRFDPALDDCHILQGAETIDCLPFASMDRVIQTEFSKRFPGIVTRAMVSSVVKALAQNEANKRGGLLAGMLTQVLTSSVTTADIRMWRSMPGDFTLNRVRRTAEPLQLEIAGRVVEVPLRDGNQLIHIKVPRSYLPPSITVVGI